MTKKANAYTAEEVRYVSKNSLVINLGFVASVAGILKIIEFILLLCAWGLMANFTGYYSYPVTLFFLIASSVAWAYVIFCYVLFLFCHHRKMGSIWPYLCLFFDICFAAILFTVSGLLTYLGRILSYQDVLPYYCKCIIVITSCNVLYAATAFGFAAAIAFLVDAYMHYREYQVTYNTHKQSTYQ